MDEKNVLLKWYTTREAAHYLRISPNALRIMVHRKQVRFYKIGKKLRFRVKDLDSLMITGSK